MTRSHLPRLALGAALAAALLALAGIDDARAAGVKDAAKYTAQLKEAKTSAKDKATALEELGKIAQIQKSAITDAEPYMKKALEDKDTTIRAAAAKAIGMTDPDAKEMVPVLVKMMKEDAEESVKLAAIQGLANMGEAAKEAIPELRQVAKDNDKKSKLGQAAGKAAKAIAPKKTK